MSDESLGERQAAGQKSAQQRAASKQGGKAASNAMVPDVVIWPFARTAWALNLLLVLLVYGHAMDAFGRFSAIHATHQLLTFPRLFVSMVVALGMVVLTYSVPMYLILGYRRAIRALVERRHEQQLLEALRALQLLCYYCGILWATMAVMEYSVRRLA